MRKICFFDFVREGKIREKTREREGRIVRPYPIIISIFGLPSLSLSLRSLSRDYYCIVHASHHRAHDDDEDDDYDACVLFALHLFARARVFVYPKSQSAARAILSFFSLLSLLLFLVHKHKQKR